MLFVQFKIIRNIDLIVAPLIFVLLLLVSIYISRKKYGNSLIQQLFMAGFLLRMLGSVLTALMYQYYYGYGDTFGYFNEVQQINSAFFNNPFVGMELLYGTPTTYSPEAMSYVNSHYFHHVSMRTVGKIGGFIGLFTFQSYVAISFVISFFALLGCNKIFEVFRDLYPHLEKHFAFAIFFVPTICFWGTGLMKDSILLAALGYLFHSFYSIFVKKRFRLIQLLIFVLMGTLVFKVKVYILLAFLPAAAVWLGLISNRVLKGALFKASVKVLALLILSTSVYLAFLAISSYFQEFSQEDVLKNAKIIQEAQLFETSRSSGSGYNIGVVDPNNPVATLEVFVNAINVTLFRPYIWEVRKPINLPAALESFVFLLMTILAIRKKIKFKKPIPPIGYFCLIFSFTLALMVGTIAFNFGTLVRYKLPIMPFFASVLVLLIYNGNFKYTNRKV